MNPVITEESELLGDSKYRAYISQVEKALRSFENTSEWADLISALGKLNKVLTNHVKYPVIPKRVTIGKRLAQCLHPALPSGVHLKALETYDIIFKCIGTHRLSADLFTYCAGLFPLLGYAAMNVKPTLLSIYETHFVPLGRHIKPALGGMLLGLLPGLEEGSEHYDRTNQLMEEFCMVTESSFFYGCLWECVLSSSTARLPAFTYVLSHYNKKQAMDDQLHFMGNSIDLLVQALCVSLNDSSVLVQRSALDFIQAGFPLHYSPLTRPDMMLLNSSAVKVVLRRDMSLNRRLYAWLLGYDHAGNPFVIAKPTPDEVSEPTTPKGHQRQDSLSTVTSEPEVDYFMTYARDMLVHAIKTCIKETAEGEPIIDGKPANMRPFRILISLLDKPEVGVAILEDVMISILRYTYLEYEALTQAAIDQSAALLHNMHRNGNGRKSNQRAQPNDKQLSTEIIKTANLLFSSFEPFFMWDFIGRTFEKVCAAIPPEGSQGNNFVSLDNQLSVSELCLLTEFLLEKVTLETYQETQTEYLPELLHQLTISLGKYCHLLADAEVTQGLRLCSKILSNVLPSMTPLNPGEGDGQASPRRSFSKPDGVTENGPTEEDQPAEAGTQSESEPYVSAESDSQSIASEPDRKEERRGSTPDVMTAPSSNRSTPRKVGRLSIQGIAESFTDFVKYGDKRNKDFSPLRNVEYRQDPAQQTLIQGCVDSFQKLFCTLVRSRILVQNEVTQMLLSQLLIPSSPSRTFLKHLQNFLPTPEEESKAMLSKLEGEVSTHTGRDQIKTLPLRDLSSNICEAFACACQLLVEFSCFPMYCTDQQRLLQNSFKKNAKTHNFPEWLQLMITCACFVINFELQMSAISTMLDLISLTKSLTGDKGEVDEDEFEELSEDDMERKSSQGATVAVVIVPSLSPQNLWYLNNQTSFYKIVAIHLWNYLSDRTPMTHQRSMELLSQLHQLAPSPWVCEDVIGNALLSENKRTRLDAHKKFSVLWHLLREHRVRAQPGMPMRIFDRSMFLMLDSLQSDTNPCRALTQTWLTHSIQRGDIARVLEPILLVLLHPDTARVSIQHVSIHQPRRVRIPSERSSSGEDSDTKIYAISSEGGNVIYHVSNHGKPISKKTTEELRTFALTTITESGSTTQSSRKKGEVDMPFERVNPKDLNLHVNPFGSENSLDKLVFEGGEIPHSKSMPNIQHVKRLSTQTCKQEGIFFDDLDQEESSTDPPETVEKKELTTEEIVQSILDEILEKVVPKDPPPIVLQGTLDKSESSENLTGLKRLKRALTNKKNSLSTDDLLNVIDGSVDSEFEEVPDAAGIHPLHTHLLLYTQKYDAQRTLYVLTCLKSILSSTPRLVTCAMSTTNISSSDTPNLSRLQNLLVRHRRSVFGKNFFSEVPSDATSSFRTSMYVEVLISVCLYFIRSYFPNLMMSKLSDAELNGNKEVQILSCEILTLLLSELVNLAKDSGRGFSTYIGDLLHRSKVQKALLHCLLASVYNARRKPPLENSNFTEAIISFNEENMDANTNETFQIKLLKLMIVLILLEDQIRVAKGEGEVQAGEWEKAKPTFTPSLQNVRYVNNRAVVAQSMLLSAVLSALKQQHLCHMHRHWITMVTSALPFMGRALSCSVVAVVNQICRNLELLAQLYEDDRYQGTSSMPENVPPDHMLVLLEGLVTMSHYCLLDNAQQDISVGPVLPPNHSNIVNDTGSAGQIFSNLINVFNPYGNSREPSPDQDAANAVPPVIEARRNLLSILPRILASLTVLWKAITISESKREASGHDQPCWTLGIPKTIRQQILEFASPVSRHHGVNMLGAVAVVWTDRRQRNTTSKRVIPLACDDQLLLVEVVGAIKVLPTDTLMQTVKQVIKQPPPTNLDKNKKRTPLEVSMLQFFYAYMQQTPGQQLVDSWPSLLALLKEGLALNLTPPGIFLLLAILNEFVQKVSTLEERKDQRDLQDIAQKLLVACSEIAGSSLEQTTWLRRNLMVKPGRQLDVQETEDATDHGSDGEGKAGHGHHDDGRHQHQHQHHQHRYDDREPSPAPVPDEESVRQYSVPALVLLAELIAPLLDVIYSSEEKDRVVPFLNSIMHHVFPYLRNHNTHNLPSFRASSQILASLSSYQYTRKAWRREALEMLLDAMFFQMDEACIGYWKAVIDNLMTHDKTTFKDLLGRVMVASSSSINLFSSREQEFEQRAQLLKRLSFTIFCSEEDQYQRYMPDIQERLADSIRVTQVPSIQAQVFLCFRVLVLRMTPNHLTSLWPTVITELVHVLLQLEQDLTPEVEDPNQNQKKRTRTQLARMTDSSWSGNGLSGHNSSPSWLHLYLAASKLLDLAMCLPSDLLPQFQLYRWAFTGDPGAEEVGAEKEGPVTKRRFKEHSGGFVPHVLRIAKLMKQRFGPHQPLPNTPGYPLITVTHIRSIQDLHGFYATLADTALSGESSYNSGLKTPPPSQMPDHLAFNGMPLAPRPFIEKMVETDFLETTVRVS